MIYIQSTLNPPMLTIPNRIVCSLPYNLKNVAWHRDNCPFPIPHSPIKHDHTIDPGPNPPPFETICLVRCLLSHTCSSYQQRQRLRIDVIGCPSCDMQADSAPFLAPDTINKSNKLGCHHRTREQCKMSDRRIFEPNV